MFKLIIASTFLLFVKHAFADVALTFNNQTSSKIEKLEILKDGSVKYFSSNKGFRCPKTGGEFSGKINEKNLMKLLKIAEKFPKLKKKDSMSPLVSIYKNGEIMKLRPNSGEGKKSFFKELAFLKRKLEPKNAIELEVLKIKGSEIKVEMFLYGNPKINTGEIFKNINDAVIFIDPLNNKKLKITNFKSDKSKNGFIMRFELAENVSNKTNMFFSTRKFIGEETSYYNICGSLKEVYSKGI